MQDVHTFGARIQPPSTGLLITATSFVLLLTLSIGGFVYWSTRTLARSSAGVIHSEEVINTLQNIQQNLRRLETESRLFGLSRDESDHSGTESTAVVLQTGVAHLRNIVSDNARQAAVAKELFDCTTNLARNVESSPADTVRLNDSVKCRLITAGMLEDERRLLEEQTQRANYLPTFSLLIGSGFGAMALLVELMLFGLLARNSMRQRRLSEEIIEANLRSAKMIQNLEDQAHDTSILTSARDELQLCLSVEEAQNLTTRFAEQILPGSTGALYLINNSQELVELVSTWGGALHMQDSFPIHTCCGLRLGYARWRHPEAPGVDCTHFLSTPPARYACIPMGALGETTRMMHLQCAFEPSPQRVRSFQALLELAAAAIAGHELRQKLESESIHDGLTGLFNRHFMEVCLESELRRAARHHSSVAVFMIDADHFKNFNDTFGHQAGDYVLRNMSDVFRACIRAEDIACRYGGEEFVIILSDIPDIPRLSLFERAEAIRETVSRLSLRFNNQPLGRVTVSIGVAVFPEDGETVEQLLRASDENLYRAKHAGRNIVIVGDTHRAPTLGIVSKLDIIA